MKETEFDYDAAKNSVSTELERIIDNLWLEAKTLYEENYTLDDDIDKVRVVYDVTHRLEDRQKAKTFLMLYELNNDCFWHAADNWPELSKAMSDDNKEFYATLIIEQAKQGKKETGYSWIVEKYDDEVLKEFISEDLLKEAVNRGFWEIANDLFIDNLARVPERYNTLLKYFKHLDLTRAGEFRTDNLLCIAGGWMSLEYINAFKRARGKASKGDEEYIVRPIIQFILEQTLSWEQPMEEPEKVLKKRLKKYNDYLSAPIIQDLIKEEISDSLKEIDGDSAYHYLMSIEILKDHLIMPEDKFKEFISTNLPDDSYNLENNLVKEEFPIDWLTDNKKSEIKDAISKEIDNHIQKWRLGTFISDINFLKSAINQEFFNKDDAVNLIETGIDKYIGQEGRPKAKEISALLEVITLQDVSKEKYSQMVHRGIKDLLQRTRKVDAKEWYNYLNTNNLLDNLQFNQSQLKKLQ